MAPITPTCVPSSIIAGDTAIFSRTYGDYPASDGWVSHFALRGASVLDIDGATDTDGASFLITISAGKSGPLAAGQYQWSVWVELAGAIYTVERGVLTVEPNVYTAGEGDLVSSTERELALIEAQIAELLASSTESYSIGQRAATKRSLDEAMKLRGILTAKLGRERGQALPSYAMHFRAPR